jgi:flagellar export protein FliJ
MKQPNALQLMVEVSETAAERAAQQLASANRELDQARSRLSLLERFHGEYQSRFTQALAAGTYASLIANYRAFLAQLSRAIEEQQRVVAQFDLSRGKRELDWRKQQHRVKSFELLVQRAEAERAQIAARSEQNQTDERAIGLWQRRQKTQGL